MENKQKILDIVNKSQLPGEDKNEWKAVAESASLELLDSLAILLESFPEEIKWLTEILKKKKAAFAVLKEDKNRGEKMLQEIYEEEKTKLEELASKQA